MGCGAWVGVSRQFALIFKKAHFRLGVSLMQAVNAGTWLPGAEEVVGQSVHTPPEYRKNLILKWCKSRFI
jgi:hypothetical protein